MQIRRTLSAPDLAALEQEFTARHGPRLKPHERFAARHHHDGDREHLCVDVVDGPAHFRFEAAAHHDDTDAATSTRLLVEFLHGVITEWLDGDREAYPALDFAPYRFRGVTVGLRGGLQRPDLEAMADEILLRADPLAGGHRNGHGHDD